MAHILIYHTHGATRTFSPPTSNSSNPSPQTYAAYAARFTHIYPSQSKVHSGILPPTSRHPVTPIRAQLSSILLAQRSALTRFEALKIPPHYAGTHFLPIHADPAFRAEINDGVGFYLDIYSSSSEVISLLHKWPFDDATKRLFRSERLPYVDLIVQFDQLNEKLHKLGQASLGVLCEVSLYSGERESSGGNGCDAGFG
ncbi:uncharacterized protein EAF01_011298 [Botrytis porri]|uniref:uncharacterized protein n=1 Tax=Botrytis porri TaxID=87229 RepID=UPI001900D3F7|nr:uncharacterized protein EAF01_011298 [Botrytis porri]KAF7886620.1 hypothetical protein EAF01_011298 [Botrytis porri]